MDHNSYLVERLPVTSRGTHCDLPAPKNQYSSDVCIDTDVPIFATLSNPIVYYGRNGQIDERETEMMSVRWRVFEFTRKIPQEEQKDLPPCPRCFGELVFLDEQF